MTGEITSSYNAEELTSSLRAYLGIVPIDLTLPEEIADGCQAVEGNCPISAGETRGIVAFFVVDTTYTKISPSIELKIVNENGELVMCVSTVVTLNNVE